MYQRLSVDIVYRQIMAVLRQNPWHVDSLLAMNQVMYSQEDYTAAADYLGNSFSYMADSMVVSDAYLSRQSLICVGNRVAGIIRPCISNQQTSISSPRQSCYASGSQ